MNYKWENIPGKWVNGQVFQDTSTAHHPLGDLEFSSTGCWPENGRIIMPRSRSKNMLLHFFMSLEKYLDEITGLQKFSIFCYIPPTVLGSLLLFLHYKSKHKHVRKGWLMQLIIQACTWNENDRLNTKCIAVWLMFLPVKKILTPSRNTNASLGVPL